ncbi:unnamed protein product [Withania somnifera]
MNISGSACTSESCESGWTTYFDEFSDCSHQFKGVKEGNVYGNRGKSTCVEEEDLSMVSDASSGPPDNFHDDNKYRYEENGYIFYPSVTENIKAKQRREKEQSGKERNLYLDDTASSPVSNFPKASVPFI